MADRYKLPLVAVKAIHRAVDDLFDRAKVRMLGPQSLDRRLSANVFSPTFSIPGIFTAASLEEAAKADERILKALITNVGHYVESYREATKAKVVKAVDAWIQEAALKGVSTDVETVLGGELAGVWDKVTSDMRRLIDTEASNARNTGALDGILRVNAAHAIEDPVVYFVVVRDSKLCDECKRLHMMEDGITPRLWYVSELGHGYHKKGQPEPKLGGLHPHCRCSIVTLMPGFGFNDAGYVSFKKLGYSAIEEQRGVHKAESVLEQIMEIPPTERVIDAPIGRQQKDYTCGPVALAAALRALGLKPRGLAEKLGTNPQDGTSTEAMLRVSREHGLKATLKQHMTIRELRRHVDAGHPAIVVYQAWSDGPNKGPPEEQWEDGHYSVVIGVDKEHVYLEDPSLDGGHGYIPIDEFEKRWHDYDMHGDERREYEHAAIILQGKKPAKKRPLPPRFQRIERSELDPTNSPLEKMAIADVSAGTPP